MLNVFSVFGSYLVGSGHLFQDEEEEGVIGKTAANTNNKRRSAFWVETIDEEEGSTMSDNEATNSSFDTMDSDTACSGSNNDSDAIQIQKELIEKVIEDLRCSQIMMTEPSSRIMPNYKIKDK